MPNIPKPELERGNYITYADEPGIIYEPDSGGGGGGGEGGGVSDNEPYDVRLMVTLNTGSLEDYATIPFFRIDGVEVTGFEDETQPDSQSTYAKTVTANPGSFINPNTEITGYDLNDFFGCFEAIFMGAIVLEDLTPFSVFADKKNADYFAMLNGSDTPVITASYYITN